MTAGTPQVWSGQPQTTQNTIELALNLSWGLHAAALLLLAGTIALYRRRPRPWLARPSFSSMCLLALTIIAEAAALLLWGLATAHP